MYRYDARLNFIKGSEVKAFVVLRVTQQPPLKSLLKPHGRHMPYIHTELGYKSLMAKKGLPCWSAKPPVSDRVRIGGSVMTEGG
jgi:hypothetical protein